MPVCQNIHTMNENTVISLILPRTRETPPLPATSLVLELSLKEELLAQGGQVKFDEPSGVKRSKDVILRMKMDLKQNFEFLQ